MERQAKHNHNFNKRMKHIWITMFIQILFTLGIFSTVLLNTWSGIYIESQNNSHNINDRLQEIIDGYQNSFKSILIPITDKIKEDPSFEEMQTWLQSKENEFSYAIGSDSYDGIAFTYKGSYVHSWNYGDYSSYDPNTRPWFQQANEANGEIAIIAPYVTYLKEVNQNVNNDILMTIAQKYNDEISFDLDLKLPKIKAILEDDKVTYKNEKIFIFNADGQILSSNDNKVFAHNIYQEDEVISSDYVKIAKKYINSNNVFKLSMINGSLQYVFLNTDTNGNAVCSMVPALEVFYQEFSIISLIALLLIVFIIYNFIINRRAAIEFWERDCRMKVIEDQHQKERLYVDIDKMDFFGNDRAGHLCKNGTYDELYDLICSRIVNKDDLGRLENFVGKETLKNSRHHQYVIDSQRFLMNMQDKDGIIRAKTIEMHRMAFRQDRVNLVEISLIDAAESVDLLKEALENANDASISKGNFLSNMSHEIRTPLNAIIGYLSIAQDEESNEEKKDYCINNCVIASKHLLQIINDILDMSSIENGKLKITQEEFDLKKEISDITQMFFQNSKAKNIKFETHIENITEEWVIGDQLRLNQILMNLLSNAIKFTPENGNVKLKIEQLRKDEDKVYMKFTISDNGIGMSKEYMSRIFHPFEQENATTARLFGGSGLGLSITNNLVNMMGGKIEVASRQNVGTTFSVTLYFTQTTSNHCSHAPVDYSHVRVLVVDDTEDDCSYIKMMLKRCGVKVDCVTNGATAIRRVKARKNSDYPYDLCIIDWNMPEMNGGEVTKKIREELGESLPIIIATAYDIGEFEETAKALGANKVVAKPLFQSTLFDLLVSTFGSYEPSTKKEKQHIDMSGIHILLAEDNAMNMDIAVTILQKAGIIVDQATNGKEALDKFVNQKAGTYDLILMDIQMPVMDGYEATVAIRNSDHEEASTIPIVAMTANAFAEDVAKALATGMNSHIAKPINYDKLFEVLNKYVDR